jgi:hypothetical protein
MSSKSLSQDMDLKLLHLLYCRVSFSQDWIESHYEGTRSVQASAPGGSASQGTTAPGLEDPTALCSGETKYILYMTSNYVLRNQNLHPQKFTIGF